MRVLGLLDGRAPSSVEEVRALLAADGTELAYTTVMTVLRRLYDKGLVTRRKESRRHLYALEKRAPAVKQSVLARVHRALFKNDRLRPIVTLVQDEKLSTEELELLRRAIDQELKERSR
jgi:predicted transcriptional regulator